MKKALFFLLGLGLALAIAQVVTLKFRNRCFLSVADETGRISLEWQSFEARDRKIPAVVVLGGSDMREAVDMDLARAFFREHGYAFFNFAMSAQDPMVEKYQVLHALDLGAQDRVIFTLGYQEFVPVEFVNPVSENLEPPLAYLHRKKVFGERISPEDFLLKALNPLLPWQRERDALRLCLLPKKSNEPYRWHNSPAHPEPMAETEKKLAQFSGKKIDDGYRLDESEPRYLLLKEIQAQFGKRIVFAEGPRNPRLAKVYSEGFFARFHAFLSPFHPHSLSEGVDLKQDDFFDFNHLNTAGSTRVTREALPRWLALVQGLGEEG
jgi:hypothetical protein